VLEAWPVACSGMTPSDKIESGYWERYLARFEGFEPASILELGVLDGASLTLWEERFPQARVVGFDRELVTPPPDTRWTAFACDQGDTVMLDALSRIHGGWDLIVDDAAHEGALSLASFTTLWPHLRPGGWYIVEDWCTGYWPGWVDFGSGHSMVDFVKGLVDLLPGAAGPGTLGIASVEFVPGQVFIRKA